MKGHYRKYGNKKVGVKAHNRKLDIDPKHERKTRRIFEQLEDKSDEGRNVDIKALIRRTKREGISKQKTETILINWLKKGDIYQPTKQHLRRLY